jgi:glycerol-3-phosphate dehydrogenase
MSAFDRARGLARLADEQFDVLVIGGGVTGAGVALDAASRGLKTALVEKADFASGTSSKSSKMVHGGIRYLQQREFRLVYENLAERQRLLDNAPHLVSPLPFLIPLFGRDGIVSKTVARSYSSALWLYDLTGGIRIGSRHRRVSKAEALEHLPNLDTDRLVAGFLYFDARVDDARLTLTLLRTAVLGYGAAVANYAEAVGFLTGEDGQVRGAKIRPRGSDQVLDVRASVVVNATGVWADDVQSLDGTGHPDSLRPAKGVHVTVPAALFPTDIAAVIPVSKDRRSIFVVPWVEADLIYLGTTDTAYEGSLENPHCTPEDVDYLLAAINAVSETTISRRDVTGVWAGLRPLLAPKGAAHLSERTSDLSRRHRVQTSASGIVSVTGGKLTTYRKMAQDAVDEVVTRIGGPLRRRRCVTKSLRLNGTARPHFAAPTQFPGLTPAQHAHLQARYGTETADVLAVAEGRPELLEPIVPGLGYLAAEVLYAARAEMAQGVGDVLARRTRALIQDARGAAAAAPAVAALLADELGWSEERAASEASEFAAAALEDLRLAGLSDTDHVAAAEAT